jgi:hypothetical protein
MESKPCEDIGEEVHDGDSSYGLRKGQGEPF